MKGDTSQPVQIDPDNELLAPVSPNQYLPVSWCDGPLNMQVICLRRINMASTAFCLFVGLKPLIRINHESDANERLSHLDSWIGILTSGEPSTGVEERNKAIYT